MNALLLCLSLLIWPGAIKRTIDGDTWILWNVGLGGEERVRLLGADAYELRDSLGPAARAFTMEWLARDSSRMTTCNRDSFGRLLAVETRGPDTLAVDLINAHLVTGKWQ